MQRTTLKSCGGDGDEEKPYNELILEQALQADRTVISLREKGKHVGKGQG